MAAFRANTQFSRTCCSESTFRLLDELARSAGTEGELQSAVIEIADAGEDDMSQLDFRLKKSK